jgi:hypothetical protein
LTHLEVVRPEGDFHLIHDFWRRPDVPEEICEILMEDQRLHL